MFHIPELTVSPRCQELRVTTLTSSRLLTQVALWGQLLQRMGDQTISTDTRAARPRDFTCSCVLGVPCVTHRALRTRDYVIHTRKHHCVLSPFNS